MKKAILTFIAIIGLVNISSAQAKQKNKKTISNKETINTKEIQWLTLEELQVKMKAKPKKVLMDVYTDWCGWCKVMDKKTFSNPDVIKYVNEKYYAVKFNAEQKDTVHFMGNKYGPEGRANRFAIELLRGKLSYPTIVIMEENFQSPQPIPGYQDVKNIEMILKYMGENIYKTTTWEAYSQSAKPSWVVLEE
jgi:thioredoxin-related protein